VRQPAPSPAVGLQVNWPHSSQQAVLFFLPDLARPVRHQMASQTLEILSTSAWTWVDDRDTRGARSYWKTRCETTLPNQDTVRVMLPRSRSWRSYSSSTDRRRRKSRMSVSPRLPTSTTPQTPGRECSSRAMRYLRRGCRSRRFDPRLAPERTYVSPHRYAPDIEHGGQRGTGQRPTPSRFRPPRYLPGRWPGRCMEEVMPGRSCPSGPVNGAGSGPGPVCEPTGPSARQLGRVV
jgi:hypothetical protein